METIQRKYPVGVQTFEKIRSEGYIYIDKSDMIWKLSKTSPYVFLSRPRRFGKSLLSTNGTPRPRIHPISVASGISSRG